MILTKDQYLEDLDFLQKTLEEVHPNLYYKFSQKQAENHYLSTREEIEEKTDLLGFTKLISKLIPRFEDGHTNLSPTHKLAESMETFRYFPQSLGFRDKQALVTYDSSGSLKKNDIITSINRIATSDILDEILQHLSAEKESFKLARLAQMFWYYLPFLFEIYSPFEIEFIRDEVTHTATYEGMTVKELTKHSKSTNIPQSKQNFEIVDNIGIMTIPNFGFHKEAGEKFMKFIDDCFAKLNSQDIPNLIIDVRYNGGGNSSMALHIARHLTDQQIYSFHHILWKSSQQIRDFVEDDVLNKTHGYYDQKSLDWLNSVALGECYHWNCISDSDEDEVTKPKTIYQGNVFVLSNEMCFSTTTDFLAIIRDFGLGKIIGSESGGLPNSYGDNYSFNLPNSGLQLSVSQKYFVWTGNQSLDKKKSDIKLCNRRHNVTNRKQVYR